MTAIMIFCFNNIIILYVALLAFIIICWPFWLPQLYTLLQYYLQSQSHLPSCFIASATLAFCCCF